MQKKTHTAVLINLAGELPGLIHEMKIEMDAVVNRMNGLKNDGLIYASEHWRKDDEGEPKYFYLIYPQKQGERRRREYIGRDMQRIEKVRAGIARAKEYDELNGRLTELSVNAQKVEISLQEARYLLRAKH